MSYFEKILCFPADFWLAFGALCLGLMLAMIISYIKSKP